MAHMWNPTKDDKTRLNMFLQKYTGRMIIKGDTMYNSGKVKGEDGQDYFQSTVQLYCMPGRPTFVGEPVKNMKLSQGEAAKVALQNYTEDITSMLAQPQNWMPWKRKEIMAEAELLMPGAKRLKIEGPIEPAKPKGRIENTGVSRKMELESNVEKMCDRTPGSLTNQDIFFNTERGSDGLYVATALIAALPGAWGRKTWRGPPCRSADTAQNAVSAMVMEELSGDPILMGKLHAAKQLEAENAPKPKAEEDLSQMSISDLKARCIRFDIDISEVTEKEQLVKLVQDAEAKQARSNPPGLTGAWPELSG